MRTVIRDLLASPARIRRGASAIARSSNRSLVLSLMLVAASSASIVATANTPPHFTSVNVSQTVIDEGQTVTLTGTFVDPDPADLHSININWRDGTPQQKIQLPAGQFSFTATHTFRDNRPAYIDSIQVWVMDKNAAPGPNDNVGDGTHYDASSVGFDVKNVAPGFSHNLAVTKAPGNPRKVTIEGDLTDPGTDSVEVRAKWGDSQLDPFNQGEGCTISKRHFKCEHQYAPSLNRGYSIELVARDDDGGTTKKTVNVQFP